MRDSIVFALLVLGFSASITARADAFLYANGVFTTINVPGAVPGTVGASGINDAGQIVGSYRDSSGPHGFLDTDGVFTSINVPVSVGFTPFAGGINNAGQIVGQFIAGSQNYGFLESNGTFTTINAPGSVSTVALGINNPGQVIGQFTDSASQPHDFVYNSVTGVYTTINVSASFSGGLGINDADQIVGNLNGSTGFLDTNGVFTTIVAPGNPAFTLLDGINNAGQIVGAFGNDILSLRGFVDIGGVFTTIDVPGSASTSANGINNHGEIVGTFTPAPEPASALLLVLPLIGGAVALWLRHRRSIKLSYLSVHLRNGMCCK